MIDLFGTVPWRWTCQYSVECAADLQSERQVLWRSTTNWPLHANKRHLYSQATDVHAISSLSNVNLYCEWWKVKLTNLLDSIWRAAPGDERQPWRRRGWRWHVCFCVRGRHSCCLARVFTRLISRRHLVQVWTCLHDSHGVRWMALVWRCLIQH